MFWSLTQRNCYDLQAFEVGTPMLARVCFGVPAANPGDVQDYACSDHPFEYGTPLVELELD